MSDEKIINIILLYVFINLILFILYKLTKTKKILHKILSIIDNLCLIVIAGYGFYRINPMMVVLVPCILLIVYPLSWGLNKELSDEDLSFAKFNPPFPLKKETRIKAKAEFVHFATFPFYYLLASWEKNCRI